MESPLNKTKVIVKVGKDIFDQTHVPAYRVFKASEMWNAFMIKHTNEKGGILATEIQITEMTLDIAIYLLRREIKDSFSRWWKGLFLSKKRILRKLSFEELNRFVDDSLTPILGSKKKGLAAQKKLYDATAELLDKMPEAELKELLQNLPSVLDGVRKKSSVSA